MSTGTTDDTRRLIAKLKPLFEPASVAVIGASATADKQGNAAVVYLQRTGFAGRIYPINPAGGEIEGLTCYRSIGEVPERVDCVFMVIPASATPAGIEACAKAGVRAVIIGASGFAEMGTQAGRQRQAEIAKIAGDADMCILGPNTNGVWNASHTLSLGFNTSHGEAMTPGPISIAAHSGALFDSFIPRLRAFGGSFSKLVPLGNEVNLDMLDALEYLIEDPATGVIGLIVEALADGARLRRLSARAHAAGKPMVALKLARSAAGAGAALAHSSRLAGSTRAYEALLRACGIGTVRSIETLAAVTTLLCDKRALNRDGDRRWIGVSSSGGGCSLMADHAADLGMPQAGAADGSWTGETARLIASYAGAGLIRNPIDGGNLHGWAKLPELIAAMERDNLMGPVVGFAHRLPNLASDISLFAPLAERKARTGSPVVIVAPGGLRPEIESRYAAEHIPVFHDLPTCFESLRCLYDMIDMAAERDAFSAAGAPLEKVPDLGVRRALEAAATEGFLSEIDSADVLRRAGVPMIESRIVTGPSEARRVAEAFGYPVVLKTLAAGVAHKHDAGLVAVGLADAEALEAAYDNQERTLTKLGLPRSSATMLVQPMRTARAELIIGSTYEPPLGAFLIAGLGGVNAELLDRVLLLPVPMPQPAIRRALETSKLAPLLEKLGRRSRTDLVGEVVAALGAVQRVVIEGGARLQSIDVNPLLITDAGCIAVDALIVPRALQHK